MAARLEPEQVLAWRLRRQFLDPPGPKGAVAIANRLCGVQAQVPSAAALAVAVRQREPDPAAAAKALADRSLLRTWAMRGTLHLLDPAQAGAFLALLASTRIWEKPAWRRTFLPAAGLAALTEAVHEILAGRVLTREELSAEVLERTGDRDIVDHLRSGWTAVLKPLAWQGQVCNGPAEGNRVTFTRPDTWIPGWPGLPAPEEAAQIAIPAYLGAYGPATAEGFDRWLSRGATPRAALRGWFADLGDELGAVEVAGRPAYARTADVDELASTRPSDVIRLLPAFDQFVLGPGTTDTTMIPADRRAAVSRPAGWIAPVVVAGGRVVGTWEIVDSTPEVALFAEVDAHALGAECARLSAILSRRTA